MKRLTLAVASVALSLAACAQEGAAPAAVAAKPGAKATKAAMNEPAVAAGTADARARDAIRKINPTIRIDQIGAAPIKGFREVIVDGQVFYVSDDGRHLLQGSLFEVETREDLGKAALGKLRRKLLATIPASERIVFAPPNPKYTVTVFTDVECGYCRKFHSEIAEVNRRGIAVEYLAFPRMGLASEDFKKMVSVWCATDRKQALTDAKNDRPVPARTCTNPVTMEYDIGRRVGLTGTPMILAPDGTELGGYLPPDKLRQALDKLAAGKDVQKSKATETAAASGVNAGAR